ncbi:hypothetical protein HDV00_005581 [Rhizophlyctis rosea]|nr:hypothetical protein HDV00_005581 [Rhizophlyctis rosea]
MGMDFEQEEKDGTEEDFDIAKGPDGEKCPGGKITHPLAMFFCTGRYADACLSVEKVECGGEECESETHYQPPSLVPIHRITLASASPYFDALFSSVPPVPPSTIAPPKSPKQHATHTATPNLHDLPTWTLRIRTTDPLRTVLEYCYFGKTEITVQNWRGILMLATRFRVRGLVGCVEKWVDAEMRGECEKAVAVAERDEGFDAEDEGEEAAVSRKAVIAQLLTDATKCHLPVGRRAMHIIFDVIVPRAASEYEKYILLRGVVESVNGNAEGCDRILDGKEIESLFAPVKFEALSLEELEVAYGDPILPKEVVADALMKKLRGRMAAAGMFSTPSNPAAVNDSTLKKPTFLSVVGKKDSKFGVTQPSDTANNINNDATNDTRDIRIVAMHAKSPTNQPVTHVIKRDTNPVGTNTAAPDRPMSIRYDSKFDVSDQEANECPPDDEDKRRRRMSMPVPARQPSGSSYGSRRNSVGGGEDSLYALYCGESVAGSEKSPEKVREEEGYGYDDVSMQLPFHEDEEREEEGDGERRRPAVADLTFSDPAMLNGLRFIRQQLESLKTQTQPAKPQGPRPFISIPEREECHRVQTPDLLNEVSRQLQQHKDNSNDSDSRSSSQSSSFSERVSSTEEDTDGATLAGNGGDPKPTDHDKWFNRNTFRGRRGVAFLPVTMEEEECGTPALAERLAKVQDLTGSKEDDRKEDLKSGASDESDQEEDYFEETITEIKVLADRQTKGKGGGSEGGEKVGGKQHAQQSQYGPDPQELSDRIRAAMIARDAMTRGSNRMLAKPGTAHPPSVVTNGYHYGQGHIGQHGQKYHPQIQPQMAARVQPVIARPRIIGENARAILFSDTDSAANGGTDESESVVSFNPAAAENAPNFQPLPPVMGTGTVGRRSALFKPLPHVPTALTPGEVLGIPTSPTSPAGKPQPSSDTADTAPYPLVGPHSPVPLAKMPPRLKPRPANQDRTEKIMTFSRARMSADSLAALAAMDPDAFADAQASETRQSMPQQGGPSSQNSIVATPPSMVGEENGTSNPPHHHQIPTTNGTNANRDNYNQTWGPKSARTHNNNNNNTNSTNNAALTSTAPSYQTVRGTRSRMSLPPQMTNAHNTGTLRLINAAKHVGQAVASGVSSTMGPSGSGAWATAESGGGRTIGMGDMRGGKKRKGIVGFFGKG